MNYPQRNPWIDPRVSRVTPSQATAYMESHGWKRANYPRTEIVMYAGPIADDGRPITQAVPLIESARDYVPCVITLIASIANLENRLAVDVLDEMLGVTASHGNNGTANGKPIDATSAAVS